MTKRAEYIAKMELQLDKLNKKMSSLETSAQEAKEEARQKFKDEMSKLRQQSKVAVSKLEELKASTEDSWESMVTDMEKMHDAFTHSFFSLFQSPDTSASASHAEKTANSNSHKKG